MGDGAKEKEVDKCNAPSEANARTPYTGRDEPGQAGKRRQLRRAKRLA